MCRMQSLQSQCWCCVCSVFSALFGIVMVSIGVSLVLNYGLLEVDTSGLPPQWQNEEGKKIVGIILTCVGLCAVGISALVSILYYTVCSKPKPKVAILEPMSNSKSLPSLTSSTGAKPKHRPKNKTVQELRNSARLPVPQNLTISQPRHGKRHKRKTHHYNNKLPVHREESDVSNLVVLYQGGQTTIERSSNNNDIDIGYTQQDRNPSTSSSSDSSELAITPSVIICVDSLPSLTEHNVQSSATRPIPLNSYKNLDDDMAKLV